MAALKNFEVKKNEFYEVEAIPAASYHPHPALREFRIIMVSKTTADDGKIMFKWPSIVSLAFFFKERLDVLPTLDEECTLTEYGASMLLKKPIDLVKLCFFHGRLHSTWLHDQGVELLNAAMDMIGVDYLLEIQRTRIMPDQLYEISYVALPPRLRDTIVGFVRVAWVSDVIEDPNDGYQTVEVRIPSMASLDAFMSSESLVLPKFNRVFTISRASARFFLTWILPAELCFRLRKRRELWVNEFEELDFKSLSLGVDAGAGSDDACARAGGDAAASAHAHAGGGADVDDASARAGGDAVGDDDASARGDSDVDDASARPSGTDA